MQIFGVSDKGWTRLFQSRNTLHAAKLMKPICKLRSTTDPDSGAMAVAPKTPVRMRVRPSV
ncbi:hypothetical protein CD943_15990 [Brevundimonas diminuta]|uniref:Uncharacterized protein n=1 Tax=Brevundimonas diminuta TaxID=293 RepID=A0A1Z3M1D3_BREDI|nr:hypothetical protein CD943_15990 [Brevundimonas diminuta]